MEVIRGISDMLLFSFFFRLLFFPSPNPSRLDTVVNYDNYY